jgi:hypothetical protein
MKLLEFVEDKLITYVLYEISPKIYAVETQDDYARAMLFVRPQEYYESSYKDFRGKNFCIFEYMDKYRKDKDTKYFGYTYDWMGYNIPSESLEKCLNGISAGGTIVTPYDTLMHKLYATIRQHQPRGKFYLLGVDDVKSAIMDHELAHALFYTNKEYRQKMLALVLGLSKSAYTELSAYLQAMGYTNHVIDDEIHAYLATGLISPMNKIRGTKTFIPKFKKVFNEYKKDLNLS